MVELLSPVGSLTWLARKQIIPNTGFSFFHSDSTVARSMAVAKCLVLKQKNDTGKKCLLKRGNCRRAKKHTQRKGGKAQAVLIYPLYFWSSEGYTLDTTYVLCAMLGRWYEERQTGKPACS